MFDWEIDNYYKPVRMDEDNQKFVDIDMQVAEKMKCSKCGESMHYEGFVSPTSASYRAFAVCNKCGNMEEF